jgi:hypothetical protein
MKAPPMALEASNTAPQSLLLPARRVLLLGASNVVRGISTIVETACRLWGRPLDVLAAFGHGRSYGSRRWLLGRELPGIVECGLWQALAQRPAAPTAALVTDVGNDLLYEEPVPVIIDWIEWCLDQIERCEARVVMTLLPVSSIVTLSAARFVFFRTLLYPACRLGLSTVIERALDLNERLRDLGKRRGLVVVEQRPEWYGFDPIHIKRRCWGRAWREILGGWSDKGPLPEAVRGSLRRWLYLRLLAPERRWLFGLERRQPQPAGRLGDGTTLSFF